MDSLMGQIDRSAFGGDFSAVDKMFVGSNIGYVHSQLIDPITQKLQRKAILNVRREKIMTKGFIIRLGLRSATIFVPTYNLIKEVSWKGSTSYL